MSKQKKNQKIVREYEICRCLITNIQSITGHKTHDIIAFMDEVSQRCLKDNGLDATKFPKKNKYQCYDVDYLTVKDYDYYPGTKVYLGVSITFDIESYHGDYDETMNIKYKYYTPATTKKLNESQYDEMVVDAMLTDTSLDFDPPSIKKGKTLLQKQQEEKEREEKHRQQEIDRSLKCLKELLKTGLKLEKAKCIPGGPISRRELNIAINKNSREIRNVINCLKNMGDKTHETLFTSTDSIFIS